MASENVQPPEKKKRVGCAIGIMVFIIMLFQVARFIGEFQFSEYAEEIDAGQYKQIFYPPPHEILETGDNVTILWMVENVATQSNGWWMEAADEKLFVPTNGLTVYNGQTGSTLWHSDTKPDSLQTEGNAVYIVADNHAMIPPYIEALDIQSGAKLWHVRTSIMVKYIINLRVHDDLVYADSYASYGRLYSSDTGDFLFEANSTLSEKEIEELAPSYNPDYFLGSPKTTNPDYFVGLPTTTDLWQFDELISNEAISEEVNFGVTGNNRLEGRDMESGDVIYSVQFSPEKMHRVSWNGVSYKHKVAVDTANNLVYVWFVDSEQLFAFAFSPE